MGSSRLSSNPPQAGWCRMLSPPAHRSLPAQRQPQRRRRWQLPAGGLQAAWTGGCWRLHREWAGAWRRGLPRCHAQRRRRCQAGAAAAAVPAAACPAWPAVVGAAAAGRAGGWGRRPCAAAAAGPAAASRLPSQVGQLVSRDGSGWEERLRPERKIRLPAGTEAQGHQSCKQQMQAKRLETGRRATGAARHRRRRRRPCGPKMQALHPTCTLQPLHILLSGVVPPPLRSQAPPRDKKNASPMLAGSIRQLPGDDRTTLEANPHGPEGSQGTVSKEVPTRQPRQCPGYDEKRCVKVQIAFGL